MSNYLVLLDPGDNLNRWGFGRDIVARGFGSGSGEVTSWDAQRWLASQGLGLAEPWILIYSGIRGVDAVAMAKCKAKLKTLTENCEIRIFHHGGGNTDLLSEVFKKFKDADFVSAGFPETSPVMPYSESGATPWGWNLRVTDLQSSLFGATPPKGDAALTALDEAWTDAGKYFDREKPIQAILEALFPLYVDVCNTLSGGPGALDLSHADAKVAIDAGKAALNALDAMTLASLNRIATENDDPGVALNAVLTGLAQLSVDEAGSFEAFKIAFGRVAKQATDTFMRRETWNGPG
jgi:hypothetical protein